MNDFKPLVSIVIPAYNAEDTIEAALNGCLEQSYPGEKIQIIVVDDSSTDKTGEIVKRFNVKYLYQEKGGPAKARNRGWREASGEIICFTDADCIPPPDWVASSISGFKSNDIAAVRGGYDIVDKENILADCIWREINYRHSLMPDFSRIFGSYNVSIRKRALDDVGGFNEAYPTASGEDNDLAYKILKAGFKIYFQKSAVVKHHFTKRLSKYLREQYQHGFWRMKLYKDHPKMTLGDDYTHFKDAAEPLLVSAIALLAAIIWVNSKIWPVFLGLVTFYAALQLIAAFKISIRNKSFRYMHLAYITSLRGVARAIGMWNGLLLTVGGK